MNPENRPDQHITSLQCDVKTQLQIAVCHAEKSTDEQLHAARLAASPAKRIGMVCRLSESRGAHHPCPHSPYLRKSRQLPCSCVDRS